MMIIFVCILSFASRSTSGQVIALAEVINQPLGVCSASEKWQVSETPGAQQ